MRSCRFLPVVMSAVLCVQMTFAAGGKKNTSPATDPEILQDITYATVDGKALKLDLYMPPDTAGKNKPQLIVSIHGGGWSEKDKSDCKVLWLLDHGFAVASIDYRLSGEAIFPAQIHDCKGAVRWLRANAGQYGYSADRIGVVGFSAGGHLALLLGTTAHVADLEGSVGGNLDQSSEVQAVFTVGAPTDLTVSISDAADDEVYSVENVTRLLGGDAASNVELARLASPAFHVSRTDAPMMMFHGEKDQRVRPWQSQIMDERCRSVWGKSSLHIIKGVGHSGPSLEDWTRQQMVTKFMDKHLTRVAGQGKGLASTRKKD